MSYNIYDCFMYYDEDVLLEFRLNYLNSYVDKFVIIECGYSHRGIKKKFNFNINKFKSFREKIIYIKVEDIYTKFKYHFRNIVKRNKIRNIEVNITIDDLEFDNIIKAMQN